MADPTIDRAAHALAIIEDEVFQSAVVHITNGIYGEFAISHSGEDGDKRRRDAHSKLLALNGLITELKTLIRDGEFSQAEQEQARTNIENFRNRKRI